MKHIVKTTLALIGIFLFSSHAISQEFKTDINGIEVISINNLFGKIDIKESNNTQLVISVKNMEDIKTPEKAKGLKPISPNGEDNTKLALNVSSKGSVFQITGTDKRSSEAEYLFEIPKGVSIKVDYNNAFTNGSIDIKGFSSEIEINTLNDDINLSNVTGPLVLHSINGNISVDFSTVNQISPISITAINGEIDLNMPANTKANLNLSTMHGEVYTNFDIDFKKDEKEGLKYIGGGNAIDGKINSGGVEINLKNINENIYLRKK